MIHCAKPLVDQLFGYAADHYWTNGQQSSDSEAFVGHNTTDDENED